MKCIQLHIQLVSGVLQCWLYYATMTEELVGYVLQRALVLCSASAWFDLLTVAVYTGTFVLDDLYLHVNHGHEQKVECHELHSGYDRWVGYDPQQNYIICRPCHLIISILRPIFRRIRLIGCARLQGVFRCLDLQIWQFLCP